jgi:hypothetical protein
LWIVAAAVVVSACSLHVPKIATPATGVGSIAAPPYSRGLVDTDRDFKSQPPALPSLKGAPPSAPTVTNVRLTQIAGIPEAETTIAVNPANPQNIVAGAIGSPYCWFYTSLDGGQTWTQGALPIPAGYTSLGDPAVTFCGDGSAYYEVLALGASGQYAKSNVFIYRSTDGGLTWPTSSSVGERLSELSQITDKPWITCDTSGSAHDGTLYINYRNPQRVTCNLPYCGAIKLRRSTDHGATWSLEAIVSDNPQSPQGGGTLAVGPTGELYVVWGWVPAIGQPPSLIKFDKSTDGGATFGTDVAAAEVTDLAADPNFRRGDNEVVDVDRSSGPHRGTIYIAFSDARYGDADILFIRSTDDGATWSAPIRVNDDAVHNLADQWEIAMAVDPLGRVIVTFYDRRRFIGTEKYEIWGAISRDGGVTFDSNFLIGDTPSDAPFGVFLGDYDSVAATSDHFYTTWADQRVPQMGETPDIYSDRYLNTFTYDEVRNVRWASPTSMSFDPQDARFGTDLDYDVAGGLLSELLADHDFTHAGCVASLWPAPPFIDTRVPANGDGYYYLVRVHKGAGVGTYGDAWPPSRPNVRDALDETLIICP